MNRFEEMAERYDTPQRAEVAGVLAAEIRKHVNGDEKSAMDFGCGTGLVGLPLADTFGHIWFVDTSPKMIGLVEKKIEAAGLKNTSVLCGNLLEGPLPAISVDYIFMAQVLLHIPNTELVFNRMYPLLNAGGHLLIVDFDKDDSIQSDEIHNGFVQAELADMAKQAGFAEASAQTFYHGKNIFMRRDASMFILDCKKPG